MSGGDRLGEFLAAGGAAVCQVADGTQKPDYMLLQGSLTPAVQVAYGPVERGGFRRLRRFDKDPEQTSVPLSAVVQACLDAAGSDAVGLVVVAKRRRRSALRCRKRQTARWRIRPPSIFAFPDVRDWLSFTAADKQRLGVQDLLARFEDLRRRELLNETAAALLEETYV